MEHLVNTTNSVWLMEADALTSVFSVLRSKLNKSEDYAGLVAMTQDTAFAQSNSSPFNIEYGYCPKYGKVAYIPIMGTLVPRTGSMRPYCGSFPTNALTENLNDWVEGTDTVLFHFNSPGGMGRGISEAAEVIANLPQKTVAYVDDMCASAAYWLASACEEIYAMPSALVGSIGAYAAMSKLTDKGRSERRYETFFSARGEDKLLGNPDVPMSPAELAYLDEIVLESYDDFVETVARYRGIDRSVIEGMRSRVFPAKKQVGVLVDGLMTLKEIIGETQNGGSNGTI